MELWLHSAYDLSQVQSHYLKTDVVLNHWTGTIPGPSYLLVFITKVLFWDQIQFTSAMLIWMDAWSLAPMILLLAELQNREKHAVIRVASHPFAPASVLKTHHLRGTYRSTNSPASFCMLSPLTSDRLQIWDKPISTIRWLKSAAATSKILDTRHQQEQLAS